MLWPHRPRHLEGSGGMLPQDFFNYRVSRSPRLVRGLSQKKLTTVSVIVTLRGGGGGTSVSIRHYVYVKNYFRIRNVPEGRPAIATWPLGCLGTTDLSRLFQTSLSTWKGQQHQSSGTNILAHNLHSPRIGTIATPQRYGDSVWLVVTPREFLRLFRSNSR